MNAKQFIDAAEERRAVSMETLEDAMCHLAEAILTCEDCRAWHSGHVTETTEMICEAFEGAGIGAPAIWGCPDGCCTEPLSVSTM